MALGLGTHMVRGGRFLFMADLKLGFAWMGNWVIGFLHFQPLNQTALFALKKCSSVKIQIAVLINLVVSSNGKELEKVPLEAWWKFGLEEWATSGEVGMAIQAQSLKPTQLPNLDWGSTQSGFFYCNVAIASQFFWLLHPTKIMSVFNLYSKYVKHLVAEKYMKYLVK